MNTAYEDPTKSRMRNAAEIAVDQAGFTLVANPERIALPLDSRINGSLVGDLQSTDERGVRTFYYLRPGTPAALPKWIANLARASHAAEAGRVYVVVHESSAEFEESCKDAGAGVLRLTDDNIFEMVVDYDITGPRSIAEATEQRITALRRTMESRVDFVRRDIEARHGASAAIIASMEDEADIYSDGFEAEYRSIDGWGEDMSSRLDRLGPRSTAAEISEVEDVISAGPPTVSSQQ